MRFFPYFKSKDKHNNGFFFYLISLVTIGFIIFIPTFLLLKEPVTNYFSKQSPLFVNYLYWLIPLTFFMLYWLTFEVYSSVLMRIAVPKFIREILLRVLVVLVYMAYALGYVDLNGFVAGFVIVYGIAMFTTFFYVSRIGSISLRHDPAFITKPLRKDFLFYTSIILLGSLGSSIVSKIDVFMISGEMGLASTGIFSIAFYMIAIVDIPSRSISAISSPLAAEALQQKDFKKANGLYQKVSLHQLIIGSFIFLLIWFNIDNIYAIIPNGEVYSAGKWVIFFTGVAKLIEITLSFGGVLINFSKHYKWGLFFVFFISGLTIIFNYLLIPIYGIAGVAMSTLFTYLLSYSIQQWLLFSKIKANPYSKGTLKQFLVIALLVGVNFLLPYVGNPWIDGIYRTLIVSVVGIGLIYFLRVSDEVNRIVRKLLKRNTNAS